MQINGHQHKPQGEMILMNRQTGESAIPLFVDGEWYLFPLSGLGPRSPWRKGIKRIRQAIAAGELPEA